MILAHLFLAPYTLPVPFWMYLYGCAATLVLSFALLAYLATSTLEARERFRHELLGGEVARTLLRWMVGALRLGALLSLFLTIAAGFAGSRDPSLNVAMTLFWVWFLLAFAYLTAIVGDIYVWINPWRTLADILRPVVDMTRARVGYPRAAAYWPAVGFYIVLVWIELFALPRPSTLATAMAAYTVLTLAGMYAFGRDVWLKHGEVFAVFFRVIGTLAPVEYIADESDSCPSVALRWPLSGALGGRAEHPSLVVFILFMLSSTTYDAIHETYFWIALYWQRLLPLVQPLWGPDLAAAQSVLTTGYWWYQWLGLITSPLFYLALYLAVLQVASALTSPKTTISLAGAFAYSLVPIAIAYHATHYVPSMLMQLPALLPQLADPFGRGWHLPGLQFTPSAPLPIAFVWHAQVAVLLAGHIAGVYLAHAMAFRMFSTRLHSVASQVPMLALMIAYTCLGLWVLSLPLGMPQIVPFGG
jgi:hypothetical protein